MRSIQSAPLQGQRVLVRVDYNVPLTEDGKVADPSRIVESIPTLRYLIDRGCRLVLMSHLGRPKGPEPSLSLRPIVAELERQLGRTVVFAADSVGPATEEAAHRLGAGEVLLLENLRFHPEEEANDPAYAASLARLGELFVEDAFGSVHRAHASTAGVAKVLPAYAGLLVEREVRELGRLLETPDRPYAALLGGAKVKDKLPLLRSLVGRVDRLLIGGAMALPLLAPSTVTDPKLRGQVEDFLAHAQQGRAQVILPEDFVLRETATGAIREAEGAHVPEGWAALDVGHRTRAAFARALADSRTVFFNGPLGKAEEPAFAEGTRAVLTALRSAPGFHVLAGGDTARVVRDLGLSDAFSYSSTGGGAALEFIEGRALPGIVAIP